MKANYITPAVTVFHKDGTINFEETGKVYEHLIKGGVDGILIMGSIGEFFALTMEQKKELIHFAAEKIAHRVRLLAGTTTMLVDRIYRQLISALLYPRILVMEMDWAFFSMISLESR